MARESLRKLRKMDLFKLLREQEAEIEAMTQQVQDLNQEISELKKQLAQTPDYVITLDDEPGFEHSAEGQPTRERMAVGSIAQLALDVQDLFGAAQRAADQYLGEIKTMYAQTVHKLELQEAEAKKKADDIISEAQLESEKYQCDRAKIADEVWCDVKLRIDNYCLAHKDIQGIFGDSVSLPKINIKSWDAE